MSEFVCFGELYGVALETGTEYDSISNAAKSLGISSGGITSACKKGCRAGGFHWVYLAPNDN